MLDKVENVRWTAFSAFTTNKDGSHRAEVHPTCNWPFSEPSSGSYTGSLLGIINLSSLLHSCKEYIRRLIFSLILGTPRFRATQYTLTGTVKDGSVS